MDQRLLLRVVISDDEIRKLILDKRPDSVEDLKVKDKLSLEYDFKLQYEDQDFNNSLCNLNEMTDLPERATIKIIPLITLNLTAFSSPTSSSDTDLSTADTVILSTAEASPLGRKQWPEFFDIPDFSVDIEYRLRQGNLAFLKDGTHMMPSRDMKHDILEKLAATMYDFKAYPTDNDFSSVAKALISKHPCLSEPGPQPGWYGWKNSLKFKMGNYRTKLQKAGCEDVAINGGKRSKSNPGGEPSSQNIKRPKRGEANYLPNLPQGYDKTSLENARKVILEEIKKKQPDGILISQMMDRTFPLRRHEIIKNEPAIKDMVEKWPALFTERQVFAEFNRITSKNLQGDFYEGLDRYTERFIELFKSRKGTVGQKLTELMMPISCSSDVTTLRSVVLKGIPVIVGDDSSEFYKTFYGTVSDNALASVTVGVLTILSEDSPEQGPSSMDLQPISTSIILEGGIVMDNIKDLPHAVCLLFGLTYALNLDYPKCMANTLKFIQTIMLGLGKKALSPKLLTLRNSLLC